MNPTGDNIVEDNKFKFLDSTFAGGMRRNVAPSQLTEGEYALCINARSRYGTIRPIKFPKNLSTELPSGRFQGIYGLSSILLVFKDGKLYARDYAAAINAFSLDPDFSLDQNVDTIYAQAVPASWLNIQRKASDDTNQQEPVLLQSPIAGTPQALVCQDGVSRPRLVFSVGSSRPAKDINEWNDSEITTEDKREYVPIGKQMLYYDNILYIVSPDGKEIYRSVTGRPLDFVVAIDSNGKKLPLLTSGKPEASRLSYAVDYNAITCIRDVGVPMSNDTQNRPGFFVGTLYNSWIVYPDYTLTLFGEPTFGKIPLFPSGPLNQESLTPLLGDTAFISESNITTFNSVNVLSSEGKNAPFFDDIYRLFDGVVQDITAAITFDNYGYLAVKTVYGYGVLVYDTQREKFVALDMYPEVTEAIKQFAEVKVAGIRRLFFITNTKIFEAFAGTETAIVSLYTREWKAEDSETDLIPRRIRVTLRDIEEAGDLTLTPFVAGLRGETQTQSVIANITPPSIPLTLPFGAGTTKTEEDKTFVLELPDKGKTLGLFITMNFQADLVSIESVAEGETRAVGDEEAGKIFDELKPV